MTSYQEDEKNIFLVNRVQEEVFPSELLWESVIGMMLFSISTNKIADNKNLWMTQI